MHGGRARYSALGRVVCGNHPQRGWYTRTGNTAQVAVAAGSRQPLADPIQPEYNTCIGQHDRLTQVEAAQRSRALHLKWNGSKQMLQRPLTDDSIASTIQSRRGRRGI